VSVTKNCDVKSELVVTSDNSIPDPVSANNGASKRIVATKNSMAYDAKVDAANCDDLGKAASSESAVIESVARLAQWYAAGAPPDGELKALKASLISQKSNWEKCASIRRENLSRPLSMPSSQSAWVALQAHVGERVRPTTKARRRAKRYIPTVLGVAFFMCLVGPVYLDEAYAPLFSDEMRPMVGRATTTVPTNANGESAASAGTERVAYRQGCEMGWNVQNCVSDSLGDRPEELFGGYRFFDPRTVFSTLPDQYLPSWARITVPYDGAAFQIPRSTAWETEREANAEASLKPKLSLFRGVAPSTPASEHSTVEQQHQSSTKLRDERPPSRANLIPLPQARPKIIDQGHNAG
jgi:hypothetical protein